jgi:hypothetical protein
MKPNPPWICCQIGAREHYAVPRALHRERALSVLITDAWADTWLPWKFNPQTRAAERHHPEVPSDLVESFDWQLLRFELSVRRGLSGWQLIMARNEWFQNRAVAVLRGFRDRNPGTTYTLFSYSYAAKELFEFAKDSGWSTVLGQMDPGPAEEKIVMNLQRQTGRADDASPAPPEYWDNWRRECRLADRIIVNSAWSRQGLVSEGVTAEKIRVVPLAYDSPEGAANFVRKYPAIFDSVRPLRILFLGQVNIRKGVIETLAAVGKLANRPVEFWIVGDVQLDIPVEYRNHPQVKWFGAVPRGQAARFYRDADLFLFPTFSDGFGLTQLEAQAWSLPVIASRQCGEVVQQGVNGYLLSDVSAVAIVDTIEKVLAAPRVLVGLAERSRAEEFALEKLSNRLHRIGAEDSACCSR